MKNGNSEGLLKNHEIRTSIDRKNGKIFDIFVKFAVNFTTMSEIIQRYRYLERFLPESKSKKLVILNGARQTGKRPWRSPNIQS